MESLDYLYFSNYFRNFKQFDGKTFDLALEHVNNYAVEHGLSEEDLLLITKVIFDQHLGVTRIRKVIRCLIPRCSVPDQVVECVLDWLLENYNQNISPFSKKIVLQWLIGLIQYNLINPAKTIRPYYELFWHFLKYVVVNAPACHLIYLLAKPEDVNRWYVKQILKAHEYFQRPKYTGALLLLFKSYRPDCVPENIPAYAVHKAFGVLPEFITNHFSKAQERLERNNIILRDVDGICWYSTNKNLKKNAIQLIPNITESEVSKLDGSKPLTSITDAKDLHKYLVQGHTPNRALSLLSNQDSRFILMFGGKNLHERFSFQLYYTLYDAFLENNEHVSYEEKDNFLKIICQLQNQMQQSIPVVSKFLTLYIIRWDGFEHQRHIYGLLEWLNFKSYEMLEECIFSILNDLFVSGTVETKSMILTTIAQLIVNITLSFIQTDTVISTSAKLTNQRFHNIPFSISTNFERWLVKLATYTYNWINTYHYRIVKKMPCLFLEATIKWDFNDIIFKLYEYITYMCKLGCVTTQAHGLITHAIITVNFMIMKAEKNCNLQIWELPTFLCNLGLFTSNPTCFLRIFRLFNRFPSYVTHTVKKDYINYLFNNKAFLSKNEQSVYALFSSKQIQQLRERISDINKSLYYERHLALSCFHKTFNQKDRKAYEEFIEYLADFLEFIGKNA